LDGVTILKPLDFHVLLLGNKSETAENLSLDVTDNSHDFATEMAQSKHVTTHSDIGINVFA
jgi:hypothetical protein